jgi:chromosome segregation ATPase
MITKLATQQQIKKWSQNVKKDLQGLRGPAKVTRSRVQVKKDPLPSQIHLRYWEESLKAQKDALDKREENMKEREDALRRWEEKLIEYDRNLRESWEKYAHTPGPEMQRLQERIVHLQKQIARLKNPPPPTKLIPGHMANKKPL